MYVQHFGLEREPFSIAPDPRFLFMSQRHREALAHLLFGLEAGGGFVLLTGDIGAGKTTVCRAFLEQVPPHCRVAYIFNPRLTVVELLSAVCEEFGLTLPAGAGALTVRTLIEPLNQFLLASHAAGRNCVLVIDEAQQLSPEVLEQLRLLTNLETSERKLLQIVLIGQPELREMLAQPGLEQLAQRVIACYHLGPLSLEETGQYLSHRLQVAGLKGPSPLGPGLLRHIWRASGGVPRRINLLCDRALLGAYGQGLAAVDKATLKLAIDEVVWRPARRSQGGPVRAWALGVSGLVVALVLGLMTVGLGPRSWAPAFGPLLQAQPPAAPASRSAQTASAPAMAASPATSRDDAERLAALLQAAPDDTTARFALAARWGVTLPPASSPGPICQAERRQGLACLQTSGGTELLRRLDRPALLRLQGPTREQPVTADVPRWALLVSLSRDAAVFDLAGQQQVVPLVLLAEVWRGEFITLWRAPAEYPGSVPTRLTEPLASWLRARLPGATSTSGGLEAGLVAFQLSEGLLPDGLPGPMTMMALNRRNGVLEPRLLAASLPPARRPDVPGS